MSESLTTRVVTCDECGANEPEGRGATEMQAVCDLVERLMEDEG